MLLSGSTELLYGENVLLRKVLPADYGNMLELSIYDGKFAQNAVESREIGERIEKDHKAGNCLHWVICDIQNTMILGTIGFCRGFKESARKQWL